MFKIKQKILKQAFLNFKIYLGGNFYDSICTAPHMVLICHHILNCVRSCIAKYTPHHSHRFLDFTAGLSSNNNRKSIYFNHPLGAREAFDLRDEIHNKCQRYLKTIVVHAITM